MVINKLNRYLLACAGVFLLSACSSDARFHEIQSARLDECNYKADAEYYECLKLQQSNFAKFKQQQAEKEKTND
ncbi:hypothetical protein [Pseudoalteromonas sp.]|uniref:hypothetical protein n=1 Tax=Pseudoalteromonas sp. TaxID=53249 RepID=UPI003566A8F1